MVDVTQLSGALTRHLSGGAPERQYLGGSQSALDAQRNQLTRTGNSSLGSGSGYTSQGVGMLGQAGQSAAADRAYAQGLSAQGMQLGQGGLAQQRYMLGQATMAGPSAAQAQMQAGLAQTQRAMLGQAAAARGGNQAGALRNAQVLGSQMALDTNQQAAILRAQEAAQLRQNQLAAAGMYGQQAQLGYGLAGQGLSAAQQSTGMLGQFGSQTGQLGIGKQNVGLGAYGTLNEANAAQLDADRKYAAAVTIANSPAATFGSVMGGVKSMYGG